MRLLVVLALSLSGTLSYAAEPAEVEARLAQVAGQSLSERIEGLSGVFLGTPYQANTLGGGPGLPENLQPKLDGLDCFTFLDAVEALRLSDSFDEFPRQLQLVRYQGAPAWQSRNHFFSDWAYRAPQRVRDVTQQIGQQQTRTVTKWLNRRDAQRLWLEQIPVREAQVHYIPALERQMLPRLRSGDYIGIYTEIDGLDVTHVGIAIETADGWLFRHASSRKTNLRVVDEPLFDYLDGKPGVVILRPVG